MGDNEQSDTAGGSREEILEDHKHVRSLLGDLEQHIAERVEDEGLWREHLESSLAAFERRLLKHFRSEEEGGLFEEMKQEAPRLARRIDQVLEDHPAILARIQKLTAGLAPGPSTMSVELLVQGTSQLITHVAEHESAENELMVGAMWDDLGGRG